ncbi:T9SS type A sorting domain-containing protein [bacterium]|nr:T9SS type A sorting domain-containing protein [bacterium]
MKPRKRFITVFVLLLLAAVSVAADRSEIQVADIIAPDTWISSFAISHNGKMTAVSSETGIWIIPGSDGEAVKVLSNTKYPEETVGLCSFSADDSELWYTRVYKNGDDVLYRLEYITVATGEHAVFADDAIMSQWTQDGKYIYYYSKDATDVKSYILDRYNTSTGGVENIMKAKDMTPGSRTPPYSVSTDNSSVAGIYYEVFDEEIVHDLCIYNLDGTKKQITFFNHGGVSDMAYSPDGKYILYTHSYRIESDGETVFKYALLAYNIASGKHYVVMDWQEEEILSYIAWSPGCKEIRYIPSLSTEIHVIGFNPGELVELTSFNIDLDEPGNTVTVFKGTEYDQYNEEIGPTTAVDITTGGRIDVSTQWTDRNPSGSQTDAFDWYLERGQQFPVYFPDGSGIVFTDNSGCGLWSLSLADRKASLFYISAQRVKSETNNVDFYTRGYLKQPLCFTPDGEEVVFREYVFDEDWGSNVVTDDHGNVLSTGELIPVINAVNPATHEARMLVRGAYELSFTPDGSKIVYASFNKNRDLKNPYSYEAGIVVRDIQTNEENRLSESGRSPVVSPDGSTVYYAARVNGSSQIFRAPVNGGAPVQMTTSLTWYNPRITSDGTWLICEVVDKSGSSESAGKDQWLRAINLKTGAIFNFVPPFEYIKASECSFSPDGSKICYALLEKYGTDEIGHMFKHIYTAGFDPDVYLKPSAVDSEMPVDFAITGIYPNPFNMNTTIEYILPENGFITLSVYNVMGQKIRELVSGNMIRGTYTIRWDGRDCNGSTVSSGIYFSHLKLGDKVSTKRMMLLK